MIKIVLTIIGIVIAVNASGQQRMHGKVSDENGHPLHNASVFIAESTVGTSTNAAGEFDLTNPVKGNFNLVVSYVGYQTVNKPFNGSSNMQNVNFVLKPITNQLKEVIITSRLNNSWKRWGKVFTESFIGTSAFAAHCAILNHEVIGFEYDEQRKILNAYTSEPIIVRNEDLGYDITFSLLNFTLYTANNDVDYQVYSLFKEMEGGTDQKAVWERNRLKAYSLSFMHFVRALYKGKIKEQGYEIKQFGIQQNKEKQRVKKIYEQKRAAYQDSLKRHNIPVPDKPLMTERVFNKDSLKYYKKILTKKDDEIKFSDLLNALDIITKKGNVNTLKFEHQLQVVYKKIREPDEYYNFRNHIVIDTGNVVFSSTGIRTSGETIKPTKAYPYTELRLEKGMPVEISESGFINNTNLYMQGFWGWWEKIATKLPYTYEP